MGMGAERMSRKRNQGSREEDKENEGEEKGFCLGPETRQCQPVSQTGAAVKVRYTEGKR